jgi:putative SOS response-associated peptidase YedK
MWREWDGFRGTKAEPIAGKHLVFSFLTTEANDIVRPVHPDAMPVLLMDQAARDTWMNAPIEEAILLQKPAANDAVRVVASGKKEDP